MLYSNLLRISLLISSKRGNSRDTYSDTSISFFYVTMLSLYVQLNVLELNPLSVNPAKWSNTLKQFVGNLLTILLTEGLPYSHQGFPGLHNTRGEEGVGFCSSPIPRCNFLTKRTIITKHSLSTCKYFGIEIYNVTSYVSR